MMRKTIWMCLMVCSLCQWAIAADSSKTTLRRDTVSIPYIVVKKDSRLDDLSKRQASINKKSHRPHMVRDRGYRIQVVSTQDRNIALAMKSDLLSRFPEEKTYLAFKSPLFKVKIGNFKTRAEAVEFKDKFLAGIEGNLYIVVDMIEYMWYPEEE